MEGVPSPENVDDSHPQIAIINAFVEITSCPSKSQALFFLESTNFVLDSAVSTFFDSEDLNASDAVGAPAEDNRGLVSAAPELSRSRSQSLPSDLSSPDSVSPSPSPPGGRPPLPHGFISSGLRKLRGRVRDPNDGDEGSESDPDFNPSEDAEDLGKRVLAQDQVNGNDSNKGFFNQESQSQPKSKLAKRRRTSSSISFTVNSRLPYDEPSSDPPPPPPPPPQPRGPVVDESQPLTSVQIRLWDGTRLISRFNSFHTIRDVRAFVDSSSAAAAAAGPRDYRLQTMDFPPKLLSDLNQTIDESGIASSVLIQRL